MGISLFTFGLADLFKTTFALPLKYHLGVWYMAVLSGSVAYYFIVKDYKSIETSEAAIFTYLQPIFSIPLAIFWLGEKITIEFVVRGVLITLGVFIAESKKIDY